MRANGNSAAWTGSLNTAIVTALAVAAWLAVRRWSGHGVAPATATILVVAVTLVGLTLLARLALRRVLRESTERRALTWQVLLSGALILTAGAVALPNASTAGLVAMCVIVTAEETWWWSAMRREHSSSRDDGSGHVAAAPTVRITPPARVSLDASRSEFERTAAPVACAGEGPADVEGEGRDDGEWEPDEPLLAAGVSQQWTRAVAGTRGEVLEGLLRATFAPGQKMATLHAAFCPPLATVPAVEAQWLAGEAATVSVALVQPYGARLEVKLARAAAAPTEAIVLVTATCVATDSTSPAVR